jgi:hypothetical protein
MVVRRGHGVDGSARLADGDIGTETEGLEGWMRVARALWA